MHRSMSVSVAAFVLLSTLPAAAAPKSPRRGPTAPPRNELASKKKAPPAPPAPERLAAPAPLPLPAPEPLMATTTITSASVEPSGSEPAVTPSSQPAPIAPSAPLARPSADRARASDAQAAPMDRDVTERAANEPLRANAFEGIFGRGSDGLGFGFGLRFRHSMESGLVAGGSVITFVQSSSLSTLVQPSMTGEIGYEFRPGPLKIVPYVGAGAHLAISEGGFAALPLVTPSLALRYEPSKVGITAGLDMRLYVTDQPVMPLGAFLTIGGRF